MSGPSNHDIMSEGFTPLIRNPTEPKPLGRQSFQLKNMSFDAETGEPGNAQSLWDASSWSKLEKSRGKQLERSNSFFPTSIEHKKEKGAIIIVDPFSTGAHIASEVCKAGHICGRVFSVWDSPVAALVQKGLDIEFSATIQHNDQLEDQEAATVATVNAIKALPFPIIAVIPGAETGVELADRLSSRLGLRSNGETGSLARRNKYLMGETVRSAGVRAVKQKRCYSIKDMDIFVKEELGGNAAFKCVVKPVQSAGSDDVYLCNDADEAKIAFQRIYGKRNGLGSINESVLMQEFLEGKEYVVDQVSRDGVHKVVAIWEYDKRSVNGVNFVYFGFRLMDPALEKCQQMIAYANTVLDALGILEGPSHMEVMYGQNGPCLVEVGSRCHGGEGTWLPTVNECVGYTQVSVTLDVYLDGKLFETISPTSYPMKKFGRECDLVVHSSGVLRSFPGEEKIRSLPSFRSLHWDVNPGDFLSKTVDCFTRPGCVELVHENEEQLIIDYEIVQSLAVLGLFDFTYICPSPPAVGSVVIVDPFSSGANLAAMVVKMGYRLILVFAERDSPVAKLVSKGTSFHPTLLVQHNNTDPDQDHAIAETLAIIAKQGETSPILAIIPGAEPGVELADKLAARYGTRNNGEEKTIARRNKFVMQETVREAGIRAVKQQLCYTPEDIHSFWNSLALVGEAAKLNTSFKQRCVVKPNQSAGTDSVFLCDSVEEAITSLQAINGNSNGLGQINDGALVQEFLQGTEFVIDGVSRDGVYKVVAIWEYDKRSVNGANFVYFGMRLRAASGPREQILIEYSKQIVKALGIVHGPSHMEVMLGPDGPCLVEVGSRCHGGEASWLPVVTECLGYSMLGATLDCYLRPDRFEALPPTPTTLLKEGCEAFLVSSYTGLLQDLPGLTEIKGMNSFRRMEMFIQPGSHLVPTIDCFTRPGSVQMVNSSATDLEKDYLRIRELESDGLFELVK